VTEFLIRPAVIADAKAVWRIVEPVVRVGETYALPRDMDRAEALAYWFAPDQQVFVALEHEEILGTYYLRANQRGGGAHVCNCGYMTASHATGRGVARAMCLDSKNRARRMGFRGMQFNCVVSTNERAVRLWQSLGFAIVGTLPGAFAHPTRGFVDAFVMFAALSS
jgi:ribosomal protein S18 acetylase RimI-like enzyme